MRKLLLVVSVLALALSPAMSQAASPLPTSKPMASTMMAGTPSAKAQIASVNSAHAKALKGPAYTAAILAKDNATVQKLLVAAGAPADMAVKIVDKRPGGTGPAARAKIKVTISCCPLTITIEIR